MTTTVAAVKRLTEYADCAGCASKLDAALLHDLMTDLEAPDDPNVLVDFRTADDAGVYRWAGGPALVQTVDFFTPIVDDPYTFGRIAAANALSDVYAMGGRPRTALAIAALPKNGPPAEVTRAIFRGGADTLRAAGVALLGGHTVSDPEIKFGYAITGEVDPDRMLTNAGAREGDVLVLTKPLGTGILVRARKYERATDKDLEPAVDTMVRLNEGAASVIATAAPGAVGACTDVTGFGLVGHGSEIAEASGVTLTITAGTLPVLPRVEELAIEFLPCGGRANRRHFKALRVDEDVPVERHLVCLDPQTSGGLLLTVDPRQLGDLTARLRAAGAGAHVIGRVTKREASGSLVHVVA
jgi:selenide, water dikinase